MWLYDTVIIIKSIYSEQHFVQSVYSKRINAGTRTHDYNNWLYALQLTANIKTNRKQGLERGRWGEHSRSNILAVSKRYRGNSACWFCPIFHLSTLQCQHSVRRYVVSARCVVTSSALGVSYIIVSVLGVCHYNVTARFVISVSARCVITVLKAEVLLYVHRNRRLIRDGSPGRPPWLSHSSWAHFSVNARCVITVGARCVITVSALGVSLQCQRSLCHYSVSARCVIRVSAFSASLQHQPSMFHCRVSARCVIIVSAPGYHYSVRAQCVITGTRCVITTSAFHVSSQSQRSVRRYNVSARCVT